ncbi:MAG TPA: hypothetical protein VGF45_20825 [Polyangia bacterium]
MERDDGKTTWVEDKLPKLTPLLPDANGSARFECTGLRPNTRYRLRLKVGEQIRELQASTAPAKESTAGFRFLSTCLLAPYGYVADGDGQPYLPLGTANALQLLERWASQPTHRPAFMLGLGHWGAASPSPTKPNGSSRRDSDRAFSPVYRQAFTVPPVDAALSRLPSVLLDDAQGVNGSSSVAHGRNVGFTWGAKTRFLLLARPTGVSSDDTENAAIEAQIKALAGWLRQAATARPDQPTLLVLGVHAPLFLPVPSDRRPQKQEALLELLHQHMAKHKQHQLLVLSAGSSAEVIELRDANAEIIGHEVVTPGLTLPKADLDMHHSHSHELTALDSRGALFSRGFGRYHGPGFAELIVDFLGAEATSRVSVRFVPATTQDLKYLANTDGLPEHRVLLSRAAAGERLHDESSPETPVPLSASGTGTAFFAPFLKEDYRKEKASWPALGWRGCITFPEVLAAEEADIELRRQRRKALGFGESDRGRFGIALSGGGVRSAATSSGFLDVLDRRGVLRKADYLSTVSGGGYAGGRFHVEWHRRSSLSLKDAAHHNPIWSATVDGGRYLAPGKGLSGQASMMKLISAYLCSLPLTLAPLVAWSIAVGMFVAGIGTLLDLQGRGALLLKITLVALFASFGVRLLLSPWPNRERRARPAIQLIETSLLVCAGFLGLALFALQVADWPNQVAQALSRILVDLLPATGWLKDVEDLLRWSAAGVARTTELVQENRFWGALISLVPAVLISYLANPNTFSMNGVLKDRIRYAFLGGESNEAFEIPLRALSAESATKSETDATGAYGPYPLFGSCLSLLGEPDPTFTGANASDYFVFSPLYCGARLTGYASTHWKHYNGLSLSDAVACSAASVNPSMGGHSNTMFTLVSLLLNLRLGVWMMNPRRPPSALPPFWPRYNLMELRRKTDTRSRLLSVSDGGFIDNLGVIELLRRRCKVILAIDNTYDPYYEFAHLENLIVRAKQELGITIAFPENVERNLTPSPINGAEKVFAIATVSSDPRDHDQSYSAILIYCKATVADRPSRLGSTTVANRARAYRTYHPSFPQDTTLDQFFDESQWAAYSSLGQEIAETLFPKDNVTSDVLTELKKLDSRMPELEQAFGAHRPADTPPSSVIKSPKPSAQPVFSPPVSQGNLQ